MAGFQRGSRKKRGMDLFIILSISFLFWLSFSLVHVCFISGSGPHQTTRLQRGKETDLMILTSEDASNVIKEV